MDGIYAINERIAAIQQTLASIAPRVHPTAGASGTGPPRADRTSASAFAAELATHVGAGVAPPAVTGFSTEQVANASAIVETGRSMGLSVRDQTIGVMTAIGESSLRVLDRGDVAGPDSRGPFQQRDNGAWGTLAQRMDPAESARSFFHALQRVDGRDAMAPTLVAHAVQRNADPDHYARSWDDAVRLVARLT